MAMSVGIVHVWSVGIVHVWSVGIVQAVGKTKRLWDFS